VWLVVMYGFYLLKSKRGPQSNGAVSSVAE
jgi:hypothetical protein